MKNKIVCICVCMLMIATAIPAVTSLNQNRILPIENGNTIQPCLRTDWSERQILLPSDLTANDFFGMSPSIDGNTTFIGADGFTDGTKKGSVYVYTRTDNRWTQQQKLVASDGESGDHFGYSISLKGNTALIGAIHGDGVSVDSGSVYVFTSSGGTWTQQAKLVAPDGTSGDEFGGFVSLDGDTALIGAAHNDGGVGAAYVFTRTGATWTLQQKLLAADGSPGDFFGAYLALDEDSAAIGAYYGDGIVAHTGCVYIFVRSGTLWTQQQKLFASDGAAYDVFGHGIDIDGNTAIAGARFDENYYGSEYVFTKTGTTWTQQQKLTAPDGHAHDSFGEFAALDRDTALIGATDEIYGGSGAAYVFTRSGTTWTDQARLLPSDGADNDFFSLGVALKGNTIIIGAPYKNGLSGEAYVFMNLPANQPVLACWHFNESTGTIAHDSSGNGHDGTLINGPVWTTDGMCNNALEFNGVNQYVNVPDSDDWAFGIADFTIEFWVNLDQPGHGWIREPGNIFIGNDEGPYDTNKWLFQLDDTYLSFLVDTPELGPQWFPLVPFSPVVGQWYHLAITHNGTTYTIFINGVPAGSAENTYVIPNPNAPLTIGQCENLGFMDGRLDDIAIYHRALSPTEIQNHYDNPCDNLLPVAHFVYVPEKPLPQTFVHFTDKSTDPDGTIVAWSWDFGDHQYSDLQNPIHGYYSEGIYIVTLRVTDNNGATNSMQQKLVVSTPANHAPKKPSTPSGPIWCLKNRPYIYTTSATDPDRDLLSYLWDWGDGTNSSWLGPYGSGLLAAAAHSWTHTGTYQVKVKAKDSHGLESSWSDTLTIRIFA